MVTMRTGVVALCLILGGIPNVVAQAKVPLTVHVTDEPQGDRFAPQDMKPAQPIADAAVSISPLPGGIVDPLHTDAKGEVKIAVVPGEYTIRVEARGFTTMKMVGVRVAGATTLPMTLHPPRMLRPFQVIEDAQATVPLRVQVTDALGGVVPRARISISSQLGNAALTPSYADSNGILVVKLSPGVYDVRATAPGFVTVVDHLSLTGPQTLPVVLKIASACPPTCAVLEIPPAAASGDQMETQSSPRTATAALESGPVASTGEVLTISAGPTERGVYTLATLKDLPHQTVTIFDHHTKANETYSGVQLMDLLAKLGVPHGEALHGKALTDYVVATGSDGYRSVVALAEIDPEFHPGMVLVADAMDGKPLGATGPFRLIVSEDKRPARSVRNLVSIELKAAE
jgi:hypothetical protein